MSTVNNITCCNMENDRCQNCGKVHHKRGRTQLVATLWDSSGMEGLQQFSIYLCPECTRNIDLATMFNAKMQSDNSINSDG